MPASRAASGFTRVEGSAAVLWMDGQLQCLYVCVLSGCSGAALLPLPGSDVVV
jgi:hypothetical protein